MAKVQRRCSFPGCDHPIPHGRLCKAHRPIKGIVGGIYCQICGAGPRSSLIKHVVHRHDGCADYKRRFGWDSLESGNTRRNRADKWKDRIVDGTAWSYPTRQKTCHKGHRLAGHNVIIKHRGGRRAGDLQRECRKCHMKEIRQRTARSRPRRRQRKCRWCGDPFVPIKSNQRFCSSQHRILARRESVLVAHSPRRCERCGETFTPARSDKRFCSVNCRGRAQWDKAKTKHYPDRSCSVCGGPFTPRRSNHTVCSDECRAEAGRARAAAWSAAKRSTG